LNILIWLKYLSQEFWLESSLNKSRTQLDAINLHLIFFSLISSLFLSFSWKQLHFAWLHSHLFTSLRMILKSTDTFQSINSSCLTNILLFLLFSSSSIQTHSLLCCCLHHIFIWLIVMLSCDNHYFFISFLFLVCVLCFLHDHCFYTC